MRKKERNWRKEFFKEKIEKLKQMLSNAKTVDDLFKIKEKYRADLSSLVDFSGLFFNTVADFYLAGKISDEDFGELITSTAISPEYFSRALKEIRMLKEVRR